MPFAITGATGQFGALVVTRLLERVPASEVVAVARDAAKAAPYAEHGIPVRLADYDDPVALTAAFAGVDRLVFVSGSDVGQRVRQHRNVVEAAQAAGVGFVAYTSVLHADRSPLLVAPEHAATEAMLAASGIAHTLLRNGWYHDNYASALAAARSTGLLLTSAGTGRVASASRADLAEAAATIITTESPEPVYELSGDAAWTQEELAETLGAIVGRPVQVWHVDAEQHATELRAQGLDEATISFLVATDAHIAAGALADTPGTLSRVLGRASTPLIDTLRALA
ncbi:MAG: SDR family oxidoreductase [Aeromicrobium sp.]|uniref:SDR family oxidoreductase n=1 Tax=Aeromicrobium sp. TaxID=1871063 RepID=UPI0039E37E76